MSTYFACKKCGARNDGVFEGYNPCHLRTPPENHDFVAATSANDLKTPETHKQPKEKRSSAKQDSFKKKLTRRNQSDSCDICSERTPGVLEGARVVALTHRELLEKEYLKDPKHLPISVNDASNGLLLCPNCHAYYDLPLGKNSRKRNIHILPDGKIELNGEAKKFNYMGLDGKKVPWLPNTPHYPTSQLLKFALTLFPSKRKRYHELIEEMDEEEYSSSEDESKKPSKKRKRGDNVRSEEKESNERKRGKTS